jgi:hypothetical protein
LGCVRDYAFAEMTKSGAVVAWIVDDTGLPKKGTQATTGMLFIVIGLVIPVPVEMLVFDQI